MMENPDRITAGLYAPSRWTGRQIALGLAMVVLSMGVVLPGIGSLSSHHGDEAYFAEGAVHMIETGNVLVPVYHGKMFLDRPPLFYWLVAASFRIFGIGTAASRLPTVLATGVLGALIYAFVLSAYGDARAGAYAVLATMSSPVTWWIAHLSISDMVMTCGVFLAITGHFWAAESSFRRTFLTLASVGFGIAGMAKGHVGVVVAGTALVAVVLVDSRSANRLRWRDLAFPGTWAPALLLGGGWYAFLLVSQTPVGQFAPLHPNPGESLRAALWTFLSLEADHQLAGWGALRDHVRFYLIGWFGWFPPWSLFIVVGFFSRRRLLRVDAREFPRPTRVLVAATVAVTALFTFVVLEVESPRYLLPIAPAVGILAARYCVRREASLTRRRRVPMPVLVSGVLFALSAAIFGVALPRLVRPPVEDVGARIAPRLGADDSVYVAGIGERWATLAALSLGRPVHVLGVEDADAAAEILSAQGRRGSGTVWVVTRSEFGERLQKARPHVFELVATARGAEFAESRELFEPIEALRVDAGREESGASDTEADGEPGEGAEALLARPVDGSAHARGLATPIERGIVPEWPVELSGGTWCPSWWCDRWGRLEAALNGAARWMADYPREDMRFDAAVGLSMIRQTVDSPVLAEAFEKARSLADGDQDHPQRRFWLPSFEASPEHTSRWEVPLGGERVNTNRAIEEALYCRENGWREETMQYVCGPMRDGGGYQTTHAAWALSLAHRNGCVAEADYRPCAIALQEELLAHQPSRLEPEQTLDIDLYAERLLMLVLTGYAEPVVNEWAERLLELQRADGSWAIPSDGEPRYYGFHATYVSSWALAEWYRRVVAHPRLRP